MLGLNTSSYHFINTQEQDTSTEVKDETCNWRGERRHGFSGGTQGERSAHELC
jgi:hypothetical protein